MARSSFFAIKRRKGQDTYRVSGPRTRGDPKSTFVIDQQAKEGEKEGPEGVPSCAGFGHHGARSFGDPFRPLAKRAYIQGACTKGVYTKRFLGNRLSLI